MGRSPPSRGRGGDWYIYVHEGGSHIEPAGAFSRAEGGAAGSCRSAQAEGKLRRGNTWGRLGLADLRG